MKKTLLSILAGITVIGAATALPGPEDRRKLCEKNSSTMVWVTKTKACIPVNPCRDKEGKVVDATIRNVYCLQPDKSSGAVQVPDEVKDEFAKRYVREVVKEEPWGGASTSILEPIGDYEYTSIRTVDGGYYVLETVYSKRDDLKSKLNMMNLAFAAYGKSSSCTIDVGYGVHVCRGYGVSSKDKCQDIADFASVLANELVLVKDFEENPLPSSSVCTIK